MPSRTPRLTASPRHAASFAVAGALLGTCVLIASWVFWEPRVQPGIDEIFTTLTARRGVTGAWSHALVYQSQPPLYYVMAALAWTISPSLAAVRFVGLIGAVAAVWAMIPLGRLLTVGRGTGLLALTCACLPIVQAYSFEGRVYSWAMAAVLLHVSAVLWLVSRPPDESARWTTTAVVVSAVVAMLLFYYAGMVVALALTAALVLWPSQRRRLWRSIGLITVLMLPWLPVIRRQLIVIAGNYPMMKVPGATDAVGLAQELLVMGIVGAPIALRPGFAWLFVALLLVVGLLVFRTRDAHAVDGHTNDADHDVAHLDRRKRAALVFAVSAGAMLLLFALRVADVVMVFPRYLTMVVPLLAAAVAGAFVLVRGPRLRALLAVLGMALVALLQLSFHRNVTRREDLRPAAAFVAKSRAAGEPVLFGDPVKALLFLHAYHGALVTLPVDTTTTRFRMADRVIDPLRVRARVDSAIAASRGFWWVRLNDQPSELDGLDAIVEERAGRFVVTLDTTIVPYRVRRFVLR